MHNVSLDEALNLLGNIILYLSTHGFAIGVLGLYLDITWLQIFVGIAMLSMIIAFLHHIFF